MKRGFFGLRLAALVLLAAAFRGCPPVRAEPAKPSASVSGFEALKRIVGNTIVRHAPKGDVAIYLDNAGAASAVAGDDPVVGRWSFLGGKLCIDYAGQGDCGDVSVEGASLTFAAPDKIAFEIVPGNALQKFVEPMPAPTTGPRLTGVEALVAMAGNTLAGHRAHRKLALFMAKDGTYRLKLGDDRPRAGKWFYSGSTLCLDERRKECFDLAVAGNQATLSHNGDAMTLTILSGNPRGL